MDGSYCFHHVNFNYEKTTVERYEILYILFAYNINAKRNYFFVVFNLQNFVVFIRGGRLLKNIVTKFCALDYYAIHLK
jgi:hypothetical protein